MKRNTVSPPPKKKTQKKKTHKDMVVGVWEKNVPHFIIAGVLSLKIDNEITVTFPL